jgi:hypothetical protein
MSLTVVSQVEILVLTKTAAISMDGEDLYISRDISLAKHIMHQKAPLPTREKLHAWRVAARSGSRESRYDKKEYDGTYRGEDDVADQPRYKSNAQQWEDNASDDRSHNA